MMSDLNLENALSRLTFDAPIGKGPKPRWERKAGKVLSTSSANNSMLNKKEKTPFKGNNSQLNKSSNGKTPLKTPGKTEKIKRSSSSGKKKTPKTPCVPAADRFIPIRSSTQFELGYYKLMQTGKENENVSPNSKEYRQLMSENLNGCDVDGVKIIRYNATKPPLAPEGHLNNLKVLYSQTKNSASARKNLRHIPAIAERILDAPNLRDDYYLNLMDWSSSNHLALALAETVYIWDAGTGQTDQLMSLENENDYISSVSWIREGSHLAIGTSLGEVQLWDLTEKRRIRNMTGHASRVGSLSWNSYIISNGSRDGNINHYDVRSPKYNVGNSQIHTQEICGLEWSPDGRFLASGGNDNILNIWSPHTQGIYADSNPLFTFSHHQAAVKALKWCPWQASVLASGGGTSDRCIKFWNANTGLCLNSVDTNSQVCGILWSREYKEIISGHGFANYQLTIWKYPTMQQIAELRGHDARILFMTMSPDGAFVASAAADETLRLWHCFPVDPTKKSGSHSMLTTKSCFKQSIR